MIHFRVPERVLEESTPSTKFTGPECRKVLENFDHLVSLVVDLPNEKATKM